MLSAAQTKRKIGGTSDIAFAVVVSVSYLAMISAAFDSLTPARLAWLLVLGTVYTVLGIYGFGFFSRRSSPALLASYFTAQIALGGLIVWLGRGAGFNALLLLPLAGQAVVLLPQAGIYAASFGILGAYIAAVYTYSGGMGDLWNGMVTFLAGLVFVVVFTQLTVEQEKGRGEVERLALQLEEANKRLREYAVQAEELATTRERNRLAREIHDGLGHYLTTIYMQIQAGQAVLDRDPGQAADILAKAGSQAQAALADVRRSVGSLRASPEQNHPLPELLRAMLDDCSGAGLETQLNVSGAERPLSPQVQLTLYRAAQEGLNNIRKHAQASRANVHLDYSRLDCVQMTIEDDGQGTDNPTGGFGLMGLRERVHLVGGEVSTQTAPSEGFVLKIEVPV